MKLHLQPQFGKQDEGEGGIRRVVEAQHRYLPDYDIEIVPDVQQADLVASHAGYPLDVPVGKPYVAHTHGLYWREYEWHRWCHALNAKVIDTMRQADCVTAPSEWVAQTIRRAMWLSPTVLYHGVDLDEWSGGASEGFVLWNKNRPDPVCDPAVVDALATRMPGQRFVSTYGSSDLPNLRITGRLPYMAAKEIVKQAEVYLCTARETFGIGTLEAMAAGVPVVGWAWGGQREIIRNGETGWLCEPHDYDGLVEGIEWAQSPMVRQRVTEAARRLIAERFTWPLAIQRYAALYEELLHRHHEPRPKVSIIMPCWNLARYLPQAIRSVQRQSHPDWELIIVDDCSPDNTAEIAKEYADNDDRIKYRRTPDNLYLAGALNYGISHSEGRYILPLDADNMLEQDALAQLANALDQDRSIDIAYGGVRFVEEDGMTPDSSVGRGGISEWPQDFDFRSQMLHRNQIPSTALFRRTCWERSGGYRTRCATAEDAENWTRLASIGCVPKRVVRTPTLIYRQRADSMSRIQADWDWTAWFPWSRHKHLVPYGAAGEVPNDINEGMAWDVQSYEPVMVSVIIPVGPGHERLLMDAVDSIQAQTYQNWECIVVNDTGKQLVAETGAPHLPSWVTVVDSHASEFDNLEEVVARATTKGPGMARNIGFAASVGKLIVPLDADDYLQSDALSNMIDAWRLYGGYVYSQWWDDFGDRREVYDPPDYDARLLSSKGAIHAVTALYPRWAWEEVGGFDPNLSHWEDWDFQMRLADAGVCGTKYPAPLFTYRKTTGRRRESNIGDFEAGKSAIMERWGRLWKGGRELAGCRGCPGGGGKRMQPPPPVTQNGVSMQRRSANQEGGVQLVEYVGAQPNTREYRGKATGQMYRFGANPSHKSKYVFDGDVPGLLSLMEGQTPMFIVKPIEAREDGGTQTSQADARAEPQLVASGSPHAPPEAVERTSDTQIPSSLEVGAAFGPAFPTVAQVVTAAEGGEITTEPQPEDKGQAFTIRELQHLLPEMSDEEVASHLARERASAEPRKRALEMMERRLKNS